MFINYDDLICYKQVEINRHSERNPILEKHCTEEGTWGLLRLIFGEIDFIFLDSEGKELSRYQITNSKPVMQISPTIWHKIHPISKEFTAVLEFYCKPHRYFNKKYDLGFVHSDLYYVYSTYLKDKKNLHILDVGCGHGRNLLFLALSGHQLTGIDIKRDSIQKIDEISQLENMTNIKTRTHDLHQPLALQCENYNLVVSLNCLQFLEPYRIPPLLTELQLSTATNGLHFLVYPIKAEPYSLPFSFTYLAKSKELHHFYQDRGWSILEYRESIGRIQKLDTSGKPTQGLFGFLLAQKTY